MALNGKDLKSLFWFYFGAIFRAILGPFWGFLRLVRPLRWLGNSDCTGAGVGPSGYNKASKGLIKPS